MIAECVRAPRSCRENGFYGKQKEVRMEICDWWWVCVEGCRTSGNYVLEADAEEGEKEGPRGKGE